jgi:signal transduction histidine kinase
VTVDAGGLRLLSDGELAPEGPPTAADSALASGVTDEAISAEDQRAEKFKRRLLRLALDVHDGPMQNLTAIGHSLNDLRLQLQALVPPEHQSKVDAGVREITMELAQVEQDLRALINALEDGAVKTIPLVEAIESEMQEFTHQSLARVELVLDGDAQVRTNSQLIALRSITRAALANVARHADAYNVVIRLRGTPESIFLEIEDDGRGFDATKPTRPGRLGLAGMRERAELLGGEFRVVSRPGGPTVISVVLHSWGPLPNSESNGAPAAGPDVAPRYGA